MLPFLFFAMTKWITDYATAEAILRHKSFREVTFKGLVPLLGNVIVTQENQLHRERRALEGRLFLPTILSKAEKDSIKSAIARVLDNLDREACLVEISYGVMSRLAASFIGLDGLDDTAQARQAAHLLSALVSGTRHQSRGAEPLTRRQARDELRRIFVDGAISRRRNLILQQQAGKSAVDKLPSDLITLLLLHSYQNDNKWDTRQIAAETLFYAVAAVDTTANLVPHLLHELWKFTSKHPKYKPQLMNMDFLRGAAAEALRLHPAIPTIFRQASSPVEIEGVLSFAEGETAGLYIVQANRDPAIFGPDAAEFNPLRKVPLKVRPAGLSFGGGAHLCLGREMALGATSHQDIELWGSATLLAGALLRQGARPDPDKPVIEPSPFERDVYPAYPILLGNSMLTLAGE